MTKTNRSILGYNNAKQISESTKNSFGITYVTKAFSFELHQIIAEISFIEDQINDLDQEITKYYKQVDSHLTSIPGIGVILASTIESEIGRCFKI